MCEVNSFFKATAFVVLFLVNAVFMTSNPFVVDPLSLVCQNLPRTCIVGNFSNKTYGSNESVCLNNSATYVVTINNTECSVREECNHGSNKRDSDTCHALSPPNTAKCSTGVLYVVIAFLGFIIILLAVCVMLCGIALCSVNMKATKQINMARSRLEEVKVVHNPTYEQHSLNGDQDTPNVELSDTSSHYSTLIQTYKGAGAMLQDDRVKKQGKRKLRHTAPVMRGTHTDQVNSIDSCGYSLLVQQ